MITGKKSIRLFQLLSGLVILSLVLTSCMSPGGLAGTGGQEEAPTEALKVKKPPQKRPLWRFQQTPQQKRLLRLLLLQKHLLRRQPNFLTEAPTEAPAAATATSTPTPTATTDPNAAQAGQAQGGAVIEPPTATPTPTSTSCSGKPTG